MSVGITQQLLLGGSILKLTLGTETTGLTPWCFFIEVPRRTLVALQSDLEWTALKLLVPKLHLERCLQLEDVPTLTHFPNPPGLRTHPSVPSLIDRHCARSMSPSHFTKFLWDVDGQRRRMTIIAPAIKTKNLQWHHLFLFHPQNKMRMTSQATRFLRSLGMDAIQLRSIPCWLGSLRSSTTSPTCKDWILKKDPRIRI